MKCTGQWMILHSYFVARFAKERRLRIWRDYVAPTANLDQKDKQFVAKVSHSQHLICRVAIARPQGSE